MLAIFSTSEWLSSSTAKLAVLTFLSSGGSPDLPVGATGRSIGTIDPLGLRSIGTIDPRVESVGSTDRD